MSVGINVRWLLQIAVLLCLCYHHGHYGWVCGIMVSPSLGSGVVVWSRTLIKMKECLWNEEKTAKVIKKKNAAQRPYTKVGSTRQVQM